MAATTTTRLTESKGRHVSVGTFGIPANTRILKGTIVQLDSNDRAVPGAEGNGLRAIGMSRATYDNTTGSEAGGTNDDLYAQVEYGVFGWAGEAGALPTIGDRCYVADNQTVSTASTDSSGNLRGYAGKCVEVRDGKYWVQMGPEEASEGDTGVVTITSAFAYDDADIDVAALTATRTLAADLPAGTVVLGVESTTTVDWDDGAAGTFQADLGDGTDADEYSADVGNIDGGASRVGAAIMMALTAEGDLIMTITGSANLSTLTGGATTFKVFIALP